MIDFYTRIIVLIFLVCDCDFYHFEYVILWCIVFSSIWVVILIFENDAEEKNENLIVHYGREDMFCVLCLREMRKLLPPRSLFYKKK